MIVYDGHLHFSYNMDMGGFSYDLFEQDSSVVDGHILRVGLRNSGGNYVMRHSYDFAAYVNSGISFPNTYVPALGLAGNILWLYDNANHKIVTYEYSAETNGFTLTGNEFSVDEGAIIKIAPISELECYWVQIEQNESLPAKGVTFHRLVSILNGFTATWDHHMLTGMNGILKFDADKLGDVVYMIFQTDSPSFDKNVIQVLEHDQTTDLWKPPTSMFPEDALSFTEEIIIPDPNEDESSFKAKACLLARSITTVNDVLAVTAEIKRPYGPSIFTLIVGPGPWKLGRDTFIETDLNPDYCCGDYGVYPPHSSYKIHLIDNTLICAGLNMHSESPAVYPFVEVEDAPNYRTITSVISANISDRVNDASVLTVEVKNGIVINAGEVIEFYETINSVDYLMGVFEADIPAKELRYNGITNTITARGLAMKTLQSWESDTCYDLWSQTRVSARNDEIGKLIRIKGKWKDMTNTEGHVTYSTCETLNDDAIMYSPEKAFKYGMVDLTFKYLSPDYQSFQGPGLCYYQKSRYDVSQELSTDTLKVKLEDVKESDIGYNGMFLLYGNKPSDSSKMGYWLARLTNNVWNHIEETFTEIDIGTNVTERAMLFFEDGEFRAYRWNDGAELLFSYMYWPTPESEIEHEFQLPWIKDGMGQACLVARNISPHSKCYQFDSTQQFIPVESTADFPDWAIVVVDDEWILYGSKSSDINLGPFDYAEGTIMDTTGDGYIQWSTYDFAESRSANVLLQKIGAVGSVSSVEIQNLKKYGSPKDLRVSIYDGGWTDIRPLGTEKMSAVIPASEITTEFGSHKVKFGYPVDVDKECCVVLMLNDAPSRPTSGSGYTVESVLQDPLIDLYMAYLFNDDTDVKTMETGRLKFIVYASPTGTSSYYVYASGVPDGDYSGLCLYVSEGAGINTSYRIISNELLGSEMRFEIDQVPYGLDATTKFRIVPVLNVTTRAYSNTLAVSHSTGTLVSVLSAQSFQIGTDPRSKVFFAFSSNKNYTVEDMATEIARKAGVQNITGSKLYTGQVTIPHGGTDRMRRKNFSVTFFGNVTDPVGVYIKGRNVNTGVFERIGYYYIDPSKMKFTTGDEDVTDDTGFLIPSPLTGNDTIVMSYYMSYITCWVNNELVGWFKVPYENTFDRIYHTGLITTATEMTIDVEWPEADIIVDNFIMDMGFRGVQLMQMMIKEKRIWFGDGYDGSLRLYSVRKRLDDVIGMRVQQGQTFTDSSIITRVRVEGGVIQEAIDVAAMHQYGNLFTSKNMEEVFDLSDANRVSEELLDDFGSRVVYTMVTGASDPRIEPNDIVELSDGQVIIVDSVTHTINSTNTDVQFDMTLEGRWQREDLPLP